MNEELNLVEILKNVPSGTKLWSCISGDIEFGSIDSDHNSKYPIKTSAETFTSDGKLYEYRGECILFPSKDQRDWSKFKVDLQEGTKVMCAEVDTGWMLRYYASDRRCYKDGKKNGKTVEWKYIVPVSDFDFTNPESNINKSI